jgi:hypothetical protein
MKLIDSTLYRKLTAGIVMSLFAYASHAGIAGKTAHGRANCLSFNESITWHLGNPDYWRVASFHYRINGGQPYFQHSINTGKVFSWRAAAYHTTEGFSNDWYVVGNHFDYVNGTEFLAYVTTATDCSAYDGWWDH